MSPRLGLQLEREVLPCKPSVFSPISFFLPNAAVVVLCTITSKESKYVVERHMAVTCLHFYSSLSTNNGETNAKRLVLVILFLLLVVLLRGNILVACV